MTRVFGVEVADELKGIVREPAALFFSIMMPVGFFALFVSLFGSQPAGAVPAGTAMVATFGAYGVLAVTLMNPGIGVSRDRDRGWLRAKKVSPVPVGVTLAAKVTAALAYAVGLLVIMSILAEFNGTLVASVPQLLRVCVVLLLGALPFALLSLAVGFQARPNTTSAVLTAFLMASAVVSGLWMPLSILPPVFTVIAQFLPTYHLAQLALAQINGGAAMMHAVVLAGMTVITAAFAAVSYRHAKS
ncbi:ABC transporter permease [Kutzneria sp. NPDC052558]|uniref:ABC transporter permease n=1 Tax=Kutzneria sp. NPDC052558 TaxID=3364121 RepID=UPI0037C70225